MAWDEFDEFEKEVDEFLKKFFRELYNNFSNYCRITPQGIVSRERYQAEIHDRGDEIEIVVELPVGTSKRIEDLSYSIREYDNKQLFLIFDKINNVTYAIRLDTPVYKKPIRGPTYVNRIFDIWFRKRKDFKDSKVYSIPIS
jgi:hypothetical protein